MPDLASWHPVLVHFSIVLLVVGAIFRWVSLSGRAAFTSPAAAVLLVAGAAVTYFAAESGLDAHGPVERVPGSLEAVQQHEEWALWARRFSQAVALAEIVALLVVRLRRETWARPATLASAALCLPLVFTVYEAAEHGGELVYSYAGGVGIRTGDPADVGRLLIAAAHHQAQADRKAGRFQDAAILTAEIARRFPQDVGLQLALAESHLVDRKDAAATLAALAAIAVSPDDGRARVRHGLLMVDALEASGRKDAAQATLQQLAAAFPGHRRVQQRLAGSPAPAPR
jgi:uncharacterized membrane protein